MTWKGHVSCSNKTSKNFFGEGALVKSEQKTLVGLFIHLILKLYLLKNLSGCEIEMRLAQHLIHSLWLAGLDVISFCLEMHKKSACQEKGYCVPLTCYFSVRLCPLICICRLACSKNSDQVWKNTYLIFQFERCSLH